jgi:N-acetylmuramidase
MNFKGQAKRLDDIDLPMVGKLIGVGEDEIHAVLDVESAGGGFDRQGRPKMLFEPHIFWKELGAGPKRDKAAAQGLAYPRWKPGAYPKDSYPRLIKAMAIDENAALRSASWGLGQVMGFNHKAAGYPSARAMVEAFIDDEEHHLAAMIRFIKTNRLDDDLRRHDWAGFARGYNGPGFAKNGYDRKLRAAFAKWQRIRDTPVPAGAVRAAAKAKAAPVRESATTTDKGGGAASALTTGAGAVVGGTLLLGLWDQIVATVQTAVAKAMALIDALTFWN